MFIYFIFSFIFDRNSYVILLPLMLGMLLNFWTYIQFFNKKSFLKKISLILLTYIIFLIQIIIGMILISTLWEIIE